MLARLYNSYVKVDIYLHEWCTTLLDESISDDDVYMNQDSHVTYPLEGTG